MEDEKSNESEKEGGKAREKSGAIARFGASEAESGLRASHAPPQPTAQTLTCQCPTFSLVSFSLLRPSCSSLRPLHSSSFILPPFHALFKTRIRFRSTVRGILGLWKWKVGGPIERTEKKLEDERKKGNWGHPLPLNCLCVP